MSLPNKAFRIDRRWRVIWQPVTAPEVPTANSRGCRDRRRIGDLLC